MCSLQTNFYFATFELQVRVTQKISIFAVLRTKLLISFGLLLCLAAAGMERQDANNKR